jgi:peroxiredoxin
MCCWCFTRSIFHQRAWAKDYGIDVPLLSDMTLTVAKAYGVDIAERGISKRATFLIDKNGTVALEHIETSTGDYTLHPDDVIEKIKAL